VAVPLLVLGVLVAGLLLGLPAGLITVCPCGLPVHRAAAVLGLRSRRLVRSPLAVGIFSLIGLLLGLSWEADFSAGFTASMPPGKVVSGEPGLRAPHRLLIMGRLVGEIVPHGGAFTSIPRASSPSRTGLRRSLCRLPTAAPQQNTRKNQMPRLAEIIRTERDLQPPCMHQCFSLDGQNAATTVGLFFFWDPRTGKSALIPIIMEKIVERLKPQALR